MELNELIMLGACSMLQVGERQQQPSSGDISKAVKIAKKVWAEVLEQDREERSS